MTKWRGEEKRRTRKRGWHDKEMRESARAPDNHRVSSYRSPRGLTLPNVEAIAKLPRQLINGATWDEDNRRRGGRNTAALYQGRKNGWNEARREESGTMNNGG